MRRDLLDDIESPQGYSPTTLDVNLGVNILSAEGYLDGPYDFGYSRIERYMDTSSAYGMKAQTLSFVPGNFSAIKHISVHTIMLKCLQCIPIPLPNNMLIRCKYHKRLVITFHIQRSL